MHKLSMCVAVLPILVSGFITRSFPLLPLFHLEPHDRTCLPYGAIEVKVRLVHEIPVEIKPGLFVMVVLYPVLLRYIHPLQTQ